MSTKPDRCWEDGARNMCNLGRLRVRLFRRCYSQAFVSIVPTDRVDVFGTYLFPHLPLPPYCCGNAKTAKNAKNAKTVKTVKLYGLIKP